MPERKIPLLSRLRCRLLRLLGKTHAGDTAVADHDERLQLALWAAGETFWDYDLVQRTLHRLSGGELDPLPAATPRAPGELPPIHPDDLLRVRQRLQEHVDGRTPLFLAEFRMDLQGGDNWTWIRARGRVVERDPRGTAVRLAGTARNISTRRSARYQQRIATEVMRSMGEAVAVLDCQYRFVTINPAFTRTTGYSYEEVAGKPLSLINSYQHEQDFFQQIRDELARNRRWSGEIWQVRKDGEEILSRVEANAVEDVNGELLHVLVLGDITEQKRAEQELRYLANYDVLTGLPNRSLMSDRLSRAIVRARRDNGHVAVLFLDLDRFKDINDSLGHATGDRILRAVAARVQHVVGAQQTVARLSGDEFTVILEDIAGSAEAEKIAQAIIDAFAAPLSFGERMELSVTPSIGISLYPGHAQVPSDLIKHADTAMYQAKTAGRRRWAVYSEAMDEKNRHRAIVAHGLRRALERNELSLVYQPRLSLHEQRIASAEALLRWDSHEFGMVSPNQFVTLAEESGLIVEFGTWALREACRTLRQWHDAGLDDMRISVNVSALQLHSGDLPDVVANILAETGVDAKHLELELTESAVMAYPDRNAATLRACRALGVGLAIDDFGTGYSSLAYLKRLPFTTLKIDREFVGDLTWDRDNEAITSAIITMGHALSLTVVAEGIETVGQLQFLQQHQCDEVQGHYVSRALPAADCLRFVLDYVPTPPLRAVQAQ